jgi:hypothetical protein
MAILDQWAPCLHATGLLPLKSSYCLDRIFLCNLKTGACVSRQ